MMIEILIAIVKFKLPLHFQSLRSIFLQFLQDSGLIFQGLIESAGERISLVFYNAQLISQGISDVKYYKMLESRIN